MDKKTTLHSRGVSDKGSARVQVLVSLFKIYSKYKISKHVKFIENEKVYYFSLMYSNL